MRPSLANAIIVAGLGYVAYRVWTFHANKKTGNDVLSGLLRGGKIRAVPPLPRVNRSADNDSPLQDVIE